MLSRLKVLPDEVDRGYLGRVMRFNGVRERQGALRALRVTGGEPADGGEGLRTGTVALLASLSAMPLDEFVAAHTTLPWRRAIAWLKTDVEHGGEDSDSIISISGLRLARNAAYLCPACVASDQAALGFSYWRRDHQLPGREICAEHGTMLARVEDEWAFVKSPANFIRTGQAVSLAESNAQEQLLVRRFHAIADALMARRLPVPIAVMREVLKRRGQACGLQTHGGEVRHALLSDVIKRAFPEQWLREVYPALLSKPERKLMNRVDGVFYFAKGASSVEPYFLALAVLFDSADEALQALQQAEMKPQPAKARTRGEGPSLDALVSAYVESRGNLSEVARLCESSVFMVSKRLTELGLPTLHRKNASGIHKAAWAFYVENLGLIESAAVGGISLAELGDLIRSGGPLLVRALRAMGQEGTSSQQEAA
jgi:hypothetical protein